MGFVVVVFFFVFFPPRLYLENEFDLFATIQALTHTIAVSIRHCGDLGLGQPVLNAFTVNIKSADFVIFSHILVCSLWI